MLDWLVYNRDLQIGIVVCFVTWYFKDLVSFLLKRRRERMTRKAAFITQCTLMGTDGKPREGFAALDHEGFLVGTDYIYIDLLSKVRMSGIPDGDIYQQKFLPMQTRPQWVSLNGFGYNPTFYGRN